MILVELTERQAEFLRILMEEYQDEERDYAIRQDCQAIAARLAKALTEPGGQP